MVAYAYNPSIQKEAGVTVGDQPGIHSEFTDSLGCGVACAVTSPRGQEDHGKYQVSLAYIA